MSGYILYPKKHFHGCVGYSALHASGTLASHISTPFCRSRMTEHLDILLMVEDCVASALPSQSSSPPSTNHPESTIPLTGTPAGESISATASTLTRTPVAPALLPARKTSSAASSCSKSASSATTWRTMALPWKEGRPRPELRRVPDQESLLQ